jgi:hypothetical protein
VKKRAQIIIEYFRPTASSERADECADGEEGGDERSVVRRQRAEPFAAEAVVEIGHDETATDDTDVY